MPSLALDFLLIMAAMAVSSAAVFLSYWFGQEVWSERFAIESQKKNGDKKIIAGQYGELTASGLTAILVFLIDILTPDVSITSVISDYFFIFILLLLVIISGVCIYVFLKIRSVKNNENRDERYIKYLLKGYIPYITYSSINYFGMGVIIALIFSQFHIAWIAYSQQQANIDFLVSTAMLDLERRPGAYTFEIEPGTAGPASFQNIAGSVLARLEKIYGETVLGSSTIVDQINTLLLFVLTAFIVNFVVTYTPVSQVYEDDAISALHIIFYALIALILAVAWVLFLTIYSQLYTGVLRAVDYAAPIMSGGSWEALQRYNEIRVDLTNRRGLTGFLLSLTSGRGSVLLALGAIQWLISRQLSHDDNTKPPQNEATGR